MKKIVLISLIVLGLVLPPALAQENPYALETKVIQNQQQLKLLQQQQAQLYLKIDNLLVKYGEIKGELDDIRHRLDALQNQINEILLRNIQAPSSPAKPTVNTPIQHETAAPNQIGQARKKTVPQAPSTTNIVTQTPKKPKPQAPPEAPDKIAFKKALSIYKKGKYDQAIEAFKEFKNKFKTSKLVPDAIFYIAESYYAKGEYDKAIINYDYLVNTFPKSDKVARATLKEGLSFIKMGDKIDGNYLLRKVIKQYPGSEAAKKAMEYLKKG